MKALVKTQKGKGFLELRDVPEPEPKSSTFLFTTVDRLSST